MLVDVISRLEKLLSYLNRCIKLQPLLVGRQANAVDVVRREPIDDRFNGGLGRRKDLGDLLGRVVFAIVRGAVC